MSTLEFILHKHSKRGYTDEVVLDVRNRLNIGETNVSIVKMYKNTPYTITKNIVSNIKKGEIKTSNELTAQHEETMNEHVEQLGYTSNESAVVCSTCKNVISKDKLEVNQQTGECYKTCKSCRERGAKNRQVEIENRDKTIRKPRTCRNCKQPFTPTTERQEFTCLNCKALVREKRKTTEKERQKRDNDMRTAKRRQIIDDREKSDERFYDIQTDPTKPVFPNPTAKCTKCFKEFEYSEFYVNGMLRKKCRNCNQTDVKSENNRKVNPERKEYKCQLEQQPRMKDTRRKLRGLYGVTGKMAEYTREHREKKREELGEDEYLEKCAKSMSTWKNGRSEQIIERHDQWKKSASYRYDETFTRANRNDIPFTLTRSQFEYKMSKPCFYCGREKNENERCFGLDRFDNDKGYTDQNAVCCCAQCNMMKKDVPYQLFVRHIEHILYFNNIITGGRLCGEYFPNAIQISEISHLSYKRNAKRRQKHFELTEEQFNQITSQPCYICGKETTATHRNGIDRVNNDIGYVYGNCKACCKTCNYYKKDLSWVNMIRSMQQIYENLGGYICKITDSDLDLLISEDMIEDMIEDICCYAPIEEHVEAKRPIERIEHTIDSHIHEPPKLQSELTIDGHSEHSIITKMEEKHGDVVSVQNMDAMLNDYLFVMPKITKSNASVLFSDLKKLTFDRWLYVDTETLKIEQQQFIERRYNELHEQEIMQPSKDTMRKFKANIQKTQGREATYDEINEYIEKYRQKKQLQMNPELKRERKRKLGAKRQAKFREQKE
jgi:hypothetical protein